MLGLIEHAGHYTVFDGLSLLVLLVWAVFAFVPNTAAAPLGRVTRLLTTPARRFYRGLRKRSRFALYLTVFLVSLGASVIQFARNGEPIPSFHDEFSYLLAADTFAHGRLTNPTPAAFTSFETFHTLMQPTYMSRYHPAQGLTLALGQVATGFPIVGVWLMMAFACVASLWLLRSVLPKRWAFWGSVALALHPQITAWSSCYWGGGVALAGGALVLGGAARIVQTRFSPAVTERFGGSAWACLP